MQAINIDSGEIVSGEVRGDVLVHEIDSFTGEADVYAIGVEVELLDNEPYPLELDCDYSDAFRVCTLNA